jgi:hypothetical protein
MASFDELARRHTDFDESSLGHLRRLVASWGLLADLCFADLLLFVPVAGSDGLRFVVQLTPLYQGVAMIRSLTLGTVGPGILVNVAYLSVMGAIGLLVTSRRLARLLLQ